MIMNTWTFVCFFIFFFQAEDGIRDRLVTGVQTCALPISEMTAELDEKMVEEWAAAIPLKRSGSVEDVANLALFLGSDLSTYITGQVLHVDGGMVT